MHCSEGFQVIRSRGRTQVISNRRQNKIQILVDPKAKQNVLYRAEKRETFYKKICNFFLNFSLPGRGFMSFGESNFGLNLAFWMIEKLRFLDFIFNLAWTIHLMKTQNQPDEQNGDKPMAL